MILQVGRAEMKTDDMRERMQKAIRMEKAELAGRIARQIVRETLRGTVYGQLFPEWY